MTNLETDLAGIRLRNPVLLAAGTAGYIDEMADALPLDRIGGVVTKSITAEPRVGNPGQRVIEARRGMLNAIGLANVGAKRFEREYAPRASKAPTTIFGSIAGDSPEAYAEVARVMERAPGVPGVELNVSCPNVASGRSIGESPMSLREVIEAVRPILATTKLFVKMPPILTSAPGAGLVELAAVAIEAGADGLTICNTLPAMAIDPETRRPRLVNITGGLSGPAIHPVAVRLVHLVHREVTGSAGKPILGAGGVMRWQDAAEFILAGAAAVEMGTALFVDPRSPLAVVRGLSRWVRRMDCSSISELIGAMRAPDIL